MFRDAGGNRGDGGNKLILIGWSEGSCGQNGDGKSIDVLCEKCEKRLNHGLIERVLNPDVEGASASILRVMIDRGVMGCLK